MAVIYSAENINYYSDKIISLFYIGFGFCRKRFLLLVLLLYRYTSVPIHVRSFPIRFTYVCFALFR